MDGRRIKFKVNLCVWRVQQACKHTHMDKSNNFHVQFWRLRSCQLHFIKIGRIKKWTSLNRWGPLPCEQKNRHTHTHDWKHWFPATSLAGGKKCTISGNRLRCAVIEDGLNKWIIFATPCVENVSVTHKNFLNQNKYTGQISSCLQGRILCLPTLKLPLCIQLLRKLHYLFTCTGCINIKAGYKGRDIQLLPCLTASNLSRWRV